ncbi:MAG: hypothetical protein R3202_09430 [Candidatus Competibacterales bacterium]|nr:hypothetical protein [Candidatus Competibacterales bacterium]
MPIDWPTWLAQAGANLTDDSVQDFGDPASERQAALESDILADLSHYGLISATGTDVTAFLQGQFTCDCRQVSAGRSHLAGYCSPLGRLLACLRLFRRGDALWLRLPRERLDPVLRRLRMFVLRADATLVDASGALAGFGCAGPGLAERLASLLGRYPDAMDEVVTAESVTCIRVPGKLPRFELYGPGDALQPLWQTLAAQAQPVGYDAWRLGGIRAGIPEIYTATQDRFVPQMVDLDRFGAIAFDKGCYVGQEIVARTRYLGRLKRHLYRLRLATDTRPQPDTPFYAPTLRGDQEVGRIVEAVPAPEGGHEALAVLVTECTGEHGAALRYADPAGPGVEWLERSGAPASG